jgi:CheY-like chemotaxis protein
MYKSTDTNQYYKNPCKKLNILIVDDDKNSRESLRDILVIRGHNVITLDEGMKCINRCSDNHFDIIFMDYHINEIESDVGELTGTDIIRLLKDCYNQDSIMYAYTGDNSQEAIKDFKDTEITGMFIKPVDMNLINDFLRIIDNNINDHANLRKLAIKNKNFIYFKKH